MITTDARVHDELLILAHSLHVSSIVADIAQIRRRERIRDVGDTTFGGAVDLIFGGSVLGFPI
jgi:hypothetical protein